MTERQFSSLMVVAVVSAGLVAYLNTFDGKWVWDDASSVLLHEHVQNPAHFFQLFREDQHAFGRGQGNFYRPLVAASFMADFWLSHDPAAGVQTAANYPDVSPFLFHLTNLVWHVAAALLLLALLGRLGAPRFVRAVVPCLYVLHPLHTEAVAYISGRADMMAAAFMYAGLWFALSGGPVQKRAIAWAVTGLLFAAALLSKESALIFPVLLGIVLYLRPVGPHEPADCKHKHFWAAVPLIGVVMVAGVYLALRATVLNFAEAGPAAAAPFGERIVQTLQAFALYIKLLFVPTGLHMERTLAGVPGWTAAVGAVLLAGCVALMIFALRRGRRRLAMPMAWFLATWLPISGLFPLNAPMAEHWLYVPMAGFWWALAELAAPLVHRPMARTVGYGVAYALGLAFVILTIQRNADWHDNERLFRATLAENPNTERIHYNLAVHYEDLQQNYAGARRHYNTLLERWSGRTAPAANQIDVLLSLGRVNMALGRYRDAAGHLASFMPGQGAQPPERALATAAVGLGECWLALGDWPRATFYFSRALQVQPAARDTVMQLLIGAPL